MLTSRQDVKHLLVSSLMWYRLLGQVGVKFVYEGGVGALPLSENGNKARRRKEAIAN